MIFKILLCIAVIWVLTRLFRVKAASVQPGGSRTSRGARGNDPDPGLNAKFVEVTVKDSSETNSP